MWNIFLFREYNKSFQTLVPEFTFLGCGWPNKFQSSND